MYRLIKKRWYNIFFIVIVYWASVIVACVTYPIIVFHTIVFYFIMVKADNTIEKGWDLPDCQSTWRCIWGFVYLHVHLLPSMSGWQVASGAYEFARRPNHSNPEPGLFKHAFSLFRSITLTPYYRIRYWPLSHLYRALGQIEAYQNNDGLELKRCLYSYVFWEFHFCTPI